MSSPAIGPHVAAWLQSQQSLSSEDRCEGEPGWSVEQWLAHYRPLAARWPATKNHKTAAAGVQIRAYEQALARDQAQPGELYTHTLREASAEESALAREDARLSAQQQQQQRAFGMDRMTRLGLETELRTLLTQRTPFNPGTTPAQEERDDTMQLLCLNGSANLDMLYTWAFRSGGFSFIEHGHRVDIRPMEFPTWTCLETGEESLFPPR